MNKSQSFEINVKSDDNSIISAVTNYLVKNNKSWKFVIKKKTLEQEYGKAGEVIGVEMGDVVGRVLGGTVGVVGGGASGLVAGILYILLIRNSFYMTLFKLAF